jgi:hypothetical protein
MDARTKPLKIRRKRARARRPAKAASLKRGQDQALLRQLAAELRRNDDNAERLRAVLHVALRQRRGPTVAEVMDAAPDISGPEFDHIFEEIERFRHSPIAMKVRDIDL